MDKRTAELLHTLSETHTLTQEEYGYLLQNHTPESASLAAELAVTHRKRVYGNKIFIRGLIEISNICKNNCLYCGIRAANEFCDRYRLTEEEILSCCREGYALGFRTFVMQGGEDGFFTDERLIPLLRTVKADYPDCAVTLSLGERSRESYEKLFAAGADRYLLRHETADPIHYALLHPGTMSFDNRMRCLCDLRRIGYQTGCGIMVGSPHQTISHLAKDLKFIETFRPQMCGIGPFIPHKDTPFADKPAGSAEMTCYLLSLVRLMHPGILLPSTTALGSLIPGGREKGILAGANVVMPNLSPMSVRDKYALYNGKLSSGAESAQMLADLGKQMNAIGYEIVTDRGDSQV
ncbi:MAG: [Clostridia bacterium]|nr:[FeFe] hydrogenase H-cluster radical SAM maturase HydE [Clostridia bacterium]